MVPVPPGAQQIGHRPAGRSPVDEPKGEERAGQDEQHEDGQRDRIAAPDGSQAIVRYGRGKN